MIEKNTDAFNTVKWFDGTRLANERQWRQNIPLFQGVGESH